HRELGQDLAVDLDLGEPQALDQAVVGHSVRAGGRVDPGDPQLPEVTLAGTAVPVGVVQRVEHLLLRLAVQPGALAAVAAGRLECRPALLLGVDRPLHACHWFILCRSGVAVGTAGSGRGKRGGQPPSILRTRRVSAGATSTVPARRRVTSLDLCSSRWRVPALCLSSFPDPVTLIRFFIPLCVLFLGMTDPSSFFWVALGTGRRSGQPAGSGSGCSAAGLAFALFLCGAITIVMFRPSCLGAVSTTPRSLMSSASRCSSRYPSSGRDCSRPRNMIVTLTLLPCSRKRRTCPRLVS